MKNPTRSEYTINCCETKFEYVKIETYGTKDIIILPIKHERTTKILNLCSPLNDLNVGKFLHFY